MSQRTTHAARRVEATPVGGQAGVRRRRMPLSLSYWQEHQKDKPRQGKTCCLGRLPVTDRPVIALGGHVKVMGGWLCLLAKMNQKQGQRQSDTRILRENISFNPFFLVLSL